MIWGRFQSCRCAAIRYGLPYCLTFEKLDYINHMKFDEDKQFKDNNITVLMFGEGQALNPLGTPVLFG